MATVGDSGSTGGPAPSRWGRWWIPVGMVVVLVVVVVAVAVVLANRSSSSGYDDATRQRFLDGCTADGGEPVRSACECLYDQIVATIPFERFSVVSGELTATTVEPGAPLELPEDFQALVAGCRTASTG
jgi:hypothetical protein